MTEKTPTWWCFICGVPKPRLQGQCVFCGSHPTATFKPDVDEQHVRILHEQYSGGLDRY